MPRLIKKYIKNLPVIVIKKLANLNTSDFLVREIRKHCNLYVLFVAKQLIGRTDEILKNDY